MTSRWCRAGSIVVACCSVTAAQPPTGAPEPNSPTVEKAKELEQPRVTINDHGDRPRAKLRFAPEAGVVQRASMTIETSVLVNGPGDPAPASQSVVTIKSECTPEAARSDGLIPVAIRYPEVCLRDGDKPEVRTSMDVATCLMNDRGMFVGGPEELLDSLAKQMLVLPEEAIGRGASWDVTMKARQASGVVAERTVSYKLLEHRGTTLVLRVWGREEASDQPMNATQPESTVKMHLEQHKGTSSGKIVVRLDRAVPSRGTLDMRIRSVVRAELNGEQGTVETIATGTIEIAEIAEAPDVDPNQR